MNDYQLSLYDHRSLCRVDSTGRNIMLIRLADFDGDTLISSGVDRSIPRKFDNRERIRYYDGPSNHGYIGVWDWIYGIVSGIENRFHRRTYADNNRRNLSDSS